MPSWRTKMRNSFGKTSHRLLRVNELIKRELSEIMQHLDWSETGLPNLTLTLTEVNCSKDIRIAKVYYIPVGRENSKQIEEALNTKKNYIRKYLGKKIHLKYLPALRFIEDKSFEEFRKTSELLKILNVETEVIESNESYAEKK